MRSSADGFKRVVGRATDRRRLLRGAWSAVAGVGSLAVAAACRSPASAPVAPTSVSSESVAPRTGGTLTLATFRDPDHFDPLRFTSVVSGLALRAMSDTLIRFTQDLQAVPGVAERWEVSDEGVRYTLHLRRDLRFHDGTPCDAEAVRFAFTRLLGDTRSPYRSDVAELLRVDTPEPWIVSLVFAAPYAPLLSKLVSGAGILVSPRAVERYGDRMRGAFGGAGCGPWMFESWEPDVRLSTVRNPEYWGSTASGTRPPYLDQLVLQPIADENHRLAALRAGQVDALISATGGAPASEIGAIKRDPELSYSDNLGLGFTGLWINVTRPPLDRRELRQALSWAIDRTEIVEVILPDGAVANDTALVSPLPGHDLSYHPYLQPDLERADALVQGASVTRVPLTVTYNSGSPQTQQIAEVVRAQAARAGFAITLDPTDAPGVQQRVVGGDFQAFVGNWPGAIDADGQIYPLLHSQGGSNFCRYSNPRLDELLDAGRRTLDGPARATIYSQAERILAEDAPIAILYNSIDHAVTRRGIRDFPVGPSSVIRFAETWKE